MLQVLHCQAKVVLLSVVFIYSFQYNQNMWRGGRRSSIGISHEEAASRSSIPRPSQIPAVPETYLAPITFYVIGHSFVQRAMTLAVSQPHRFPRLQASSGTRFIGLPGATAMSLLDHLQRDIFPMSRPRVPPHVTVHAGENELDNRDLTEGPEFYVDWLLELLSFLFRAGAQKIAVIKLYPRGESPNPDRRRRPLEDFECRRNVYNAVLVSRARIRFGDQVIFFQQNAYQRVAPHHRFLLDGVHLQPERLRTYTHILQRTRSLLERECPIAPGSSL